MSRRDSSRWKCRKRGSEQRGSCSTGLKPNGEARERAGWRVRRGEVTPHSFREEAERWRRKSGMDGNAMARRGNTREETQAEFLMNQRDDPMQWPADVATWRSKAKKIDQTKGPCCRNLRFPSGPIFTSSPPCRGGGIPSVSPGGETPITLSSRNEITPSRGKRTEEESPVSPLGEGRAVAFLTVLHLAPQQRRETLLRARRSGMLVDDANVRRLSPDG